MTTPVFFLIAGEASGDILGARLMRALRHKLVGAVSFKGIGGPQMVAEGLELIFPNTELMHFGVIEVLCHIPRLLARISEATREVIKTKPAALITIDSPDFCFRVAKKIRKKAGASIPLIHYVAPTVWAWRPGRAKEIAQFLDHLLAVLPFEPPYFTRAHLPCTFVGHSIVEGDASHGSNAIFRSKRKISLATPILTVLPGSRLSEVTRLLPIFRQTIALLRSPCPNLHIAIPVVPHLKDLIAREVSTWDIPYSIVEGERDKYDAMAASRAALACSGTVALELALARLPAVIAYKINNLTAFLYRKFIRVRFANLVNIMHAQEVVPEFIQENCTPEKLARALETLLTNESARERQKEGLAATATWLGQGQFVPSERAAETVLTAILPKNDPPSRVDPRPTVVLQVLPALVTGGVERGTVEVAAALVKQGFRALVASSGGPMVKEIEATGATHITLSLKSKNPFTMLTNIHKLSKLIRDHKVDIVHVRSRAPAWSAYASTRKSRASFVTTFHSAYGIGSDIKRLYNSVMAKGDRVIAISNFVARYATTTYGVSPKILRVIPRGVDMDVFNRHHISNARIDELRAQWNVSEKVPVILMPGRLTRWKGQTILIQALEHMQRRDFFCVIVGGGRESRYGQELLKRIKRAHLEKNVGLFDTCRDMAAAYCVADVVVVPSTRPEGFGRVVIEAQAMGVPVVASDHGGAKETIIDGKTGWLTSPGDARHLALILDHILSMDKTKRDNFSEQAIAHIREFFTTELMIKRTLEVYRELTGTVW